GGGQGTALGDRPHAVRPPLRAQRALAGLLRSADEERHRVRHHHRVYLVLGREHHPRAQGPERGLLRITSQPMNPDLWTISVSRELQAMRVGLLACAMITLGALAYAIASSPTRVANRLGLRGLKRQRVLTQNELWANMEPIVRWLGLRLSGILGERQRAE